MQGQLKCGWSHPFWPGVTMLDTGIPAPSFTVPVHDGTTFDLTAERGHWVLIWWYPKADTPG